MIKANNKIIYSFQEVINQSQFFIVKRKGYPMSKKEPAVTIFWRSPPLTDHFTIV
jgi:hypothetical protein